MRAVKCTGAARRSASNYTANLQYVRHTQQPRLPTIKEGVVPSRLSAASGSRRVDALVSSAAEQLDVSNPPAPSTLGVFWDGVHIGQMPLEELEAVAACLPDPLSAPLQLHVFLALSNSEHPQECLLVDFLPARPRDPATAVSLLTGGSVQGQMRVRRLSGWVRGRNVRTRLASQLQRPLSHAEAESLIVGFNGRWDAQLQLLRNDCRHYAAALLSHLTARPWSVSDLWGP